MEGLEPWGQVLWSLIGILVVAFIIAGLSDLF